MVPLNPAVTAEILLSNDAAWTAARVRRSKGNCWIMRSIVAFLFITASAIWAQTDRVAETEKRIAQRPDAAVLRTDLLRQLTFRGIALPPAEVRDKRRRQIVWIIEHHPEWTILED